jgi:uncharacterized membrane-anchored protein
MSKPTEKVEMAGGLALIGGLVAGFAGLIAALVSFFSFNLIAVGVCLVAAGISFGLVANAIWRN